MLSITTWKPGHITRKIAEVGTWQEAWDIAAKESVDGWDAIIWGGGTQVVYRNGKYFHASSGWAY